MSTKTSSNIEGMCTRVSGNPEDAVVVEAPLDAFDQYMHPHRIIHLYSIVQTN